MASVPGKNATAIAAAAAIAKHALLQKMALAQQQNVTVAKVYAAAIASIIIAFTILYWSRLIHARLVIGNVKRSKVILPHISIARICRRSLDRKLPGFTSVGHGLLVLIYLAINVTLTVTNIDLNVMNVAKRLGWMTVLNVAFVTFLALKNTPLAYLTGYSYERLNPLHQISGFATIMCAVLHGTLQCVVWSQKGMMSIMLEKAQVSGITAVCALLFILVTALLLQRLTYELFYIVHIFMYMLLIINIALHRPNLATKTIIITIFAGSMWASDRIFRGLRILWNSYDNRATIYPLPHGGTRVTLSHSPSRTILATHCFLWIPKVRLIETHPFTIVNATRTSLDLVISAHDGFTHDLHNYAVRNPGISLRASFDGPYGALPNFGKIANKVVLIAGGSGASFTFGVALDIIKKLPQTCRITIDFIWTVRQPECISWFREELNILQCSPHVNLILHTTKPAATNTLSSLPPDDETVISTSEIECPKTIERTFSSVDVEKVSHIAEITPWDSSSSLNLIPGRPDIASLIRDVVSKSVRGERIAIAACGPDAMMRIVRHTAADCISVEGASIELHCEQFGW